MLGTAVPSASALPPVKHVLRDMLEKTRGCSNAFGPTAWIQAPYLSRELPARPVPTAPTRRPHSASNYIAMVSGSRRRPRTRPTARTVDLDRSRQRVAVRARQGDGVYTVELQRRSPTRCRAGDVARVQRGDPGACSMRRRTATTRAANPFVFFDSLRESGQCQANDVGLISSAPDWPRSATTPNLVYIRSEPVQRTAIRRARRRSPPAKNPVTDDPGWPCGQAGAGIFAWPFFPRPLSWPKDSLRPTPAVQQ